jgi:hypothetical protein
VTRLMRVKREVVDLRRGIVGLHEDYLSLSTRLDNTRKGECFERVASRGLPEEYLAAVPSVAGPFPPGSLIDRILGGENLISIPDLAETEVIRLTPRFGLLVRLAGARGYIAAALREDF